MLRRTIRPRGRISGLSAKRRADYSDTEAAGSIEVDGKVAGARGLEELEVWELFEEGAGEGGAFADCGYDFEGGEAGDELGFAGGGGGGVGVGGEGGGEVGYFEGGGGELG